jgi:hypothetical protein
MKRRDQGHLHPLLEHPETNMSRPGIEPVPLASQASTLAKSYSNTICCYYSEPILLHKNPSLLSVSVTRILPSLHFNAMVRTHNDMLILN